MTEPTSNGASLRWLAIAALVAAALIWFALRPKPSEVAPRTEPAQQQALAKASVPVAPPSPPAPAAPTPATKVLSPPVSAANASPPPPPHQPQGGELQAAFEREVPDATAPQAEARIRDIFKQQVEFDIVFRHVICTRSVCKIDLRWSPELSDPYNGGLIKVVEEFSRELALVPEGGAGPDSPMPVPMIAYIARKGYSIEGLLAERAATGR